MAEQWIKLGHTTPDKPEIFRMAQLLGIDPNEVLGACIRLWIWADQQIADRNAVSVTPVTLDRVAFCDGFAKALQSVGWLEEQGGFLVLPNFERHNGETAKKRALAADRAAKHRKKSSRDRNAAGVTNALPDEDEEVLEREIRARARARPVDNSGPQTLCPEDFQPTKITTDTARVRNLPIANDPDAITEFVLYHRDKGTTADADGWQTKYLLFLARRKRMAVGGQRYGKGDRSGAESPAQSRQQRAKEILKDDIARTAARMGDGVHGADAAAVPGEVDGKVVNGE